MSAGSVLFFRFVLFLAFFGHGFVSLGFSPGFELHYRIFESVNFFHFDVHTFLYYQGLSDIILAFAILLGIYPRVLLSFALIYLASVAVAGCFYFWNQTGSIFGITESLRRFPWIFYSLFLFIFYWKGNKRFDLLRMGIGFAFLAHGLASLGFFGLKGGHIEIASQLVSEETANAVVYYSGFSDTLFGILLLTGIFSRHVAFIGSLWLLAVVYLSYLVGFPDGIFRSGFLLSAIYVAVDKRCHNYIWHKPLIA